MVTVLAATAPALFTGQNPCLKVAFISALTVFPKGRYGLAGENAELQRREVVCPGHTARRRLAWDWDDSLDDSKTCFLPGDFSVCSASSTLLTGKIKARPQCRAQTFRAAPSLPCLPPCPALPRISSPLYLTFLGGIAQGGSLTLTRPLDQAGAALPQVTGHARGLCPTQAQRPPDCPARVEAAFSASTCTQGPRLEPHCVQTPRGGQGTGLTSPPHETFHLCC